MSNQSNTAAAFPIGGVLGVVFITLKLTGVIDWSWWWVLAPFWIPLAFAGVILVICALVVLIDEVMSRR